MKTNLRQKILNELKFLLKEAEEEAGGTGMFSEELDDTIKDINSASKGTAGGVSYIDLTGATVNTDEGELAQFIDSGKQVSKEEDVSEESKTAFNKVCKTHVLLINRVYPSADTFYYVTCKQIGNISVPISAKKLVDEGNTAMLKATMNKIIAGETDSANTEADNFCVDKADNTPVPQTISGTMLNLVCRDKKAVNAGQQPAPAPTPAPAPDAGQSATAKGNIKCADEQAIVIYQQWLKYVKGQRVSVDGSYGPLTHAAAAAVLSEKRTFDEVKANPNEICKFALENKVKWSAEIKKANSKVVPGQKEAGGAGGVKGGQKGLGGTMYTSIEDAMAYVNLRAYACAPENKKAIEEEMKKLGIQPKESEGELKSISTQTIDGLIKQKCQAVTTTVKESKNYYDNKKLNEAKKLFNKLLKNL